MDSIQISEQRHQVAAPAPHMSRNNSVLEWLRSEQARRAGASAAARQQRSRRRRRSSASPSVPLRGGRPVRGWIVSQKTQKRVRRRWRRHASVILPLLSKEFARLRIVAKINLSRASDVRRHLWCCAKLRLLAHSGEHQSACCCLCFMGGKSQTKHEHTNTSPRIVGVVCPSWLGILTRHSPESA